MSTVFGDDVSQLSQSNAQSSFQSSALLTMMMMVLLFKGGNNDDDDDLDLERWQS